MSTPFQNRLVGTVIVAAIVIIFLPDILDGEKNSNQVHFEKIPETPVFTGKISTKKFPEDKLIEKEEKQLSDEQAVDVLAPVKDNASSSLNESAKLDEVNKTDKVKVTPATARQSESVNITSNTSKSTDIAKQKTNMPERAVSKQAWVIHLGSFKHKQNVAQLLQKLKDNGYTTFTRPIKTKQGTLTKVFIGPELIKSSLDKKLPALKKLTNTQGKVALFEPLN